MEFAWTVPVALIVVGGAYAIAARYFAHRERMAGARAYPSPGGARRSAE